MLKPETFKFQEENGYQSKNPCLQYQVYYQVCISSCGTDFNSNKEVVSCTNNSSATVAPMDISFHTSHYCSSQGSQLGKTIGDFPLSPAACIAPSSTMKTSQQEGSFLVSTYLISPCAMINMCGVLSNRVFPSSSGGQGRAMAIVCIIWGCVSRTCLTNNLKGSITLLALGFLFGNLWHLG